MEPLAMFLVGNQLHLVLLCIWLVAIMAPVLLAADTFSEAEKQAFVDIHNKVRSEADPTAEAMNSVVWSAKLECLAIKAAHKCKFDHSEGGEYANLGENIYMGYSTSAVHITKKWFNEKDNHDFTTKVCKVGKDCGHYTQVMTADVVEIGCGIRLACDGKKNNNLVFCEYSHGNGFYKHGPKCSKCPKDRPCDKGLCTGKKQDSLPDGAENCLETKGCSVVFARGCFSRAAVQSGLLVILILFIELF